MLAAKILLNSHEFHHHRYPYNPCSVAFHSCSHSLALSFCGRAYLAISCEIDVICWVRGTISLPIFRFMREIYRTRASHNRGKKRHIEWCCENPILDTTVGRASVGIRKCIIKLSLFCFTMRATESTTCRERGQTARQMKRKTTQLKHWAENERGKQSGKQHTKNF